MFLRNFYKCLAVHHVAPNSSGDSGVQVRFYNGNTENLVLNAYSVEVGLSTNGNPYMGTILKGTGCGVIIGTGDTPVTFDDYCLSGGQITTFSATSVKEYRHSEGGCEMSYTYTITNTGSEVFTIKEIGLMGSQKNSNGTSRNILYERTVLETPVTIPAGGIGEVTYTVRFEYPTA